MCYLPSAVYFSYMAGLPAKFAHFRPPPTYLKFIYQLALVADSKILHDYHSLEHTAFFIFDRDLLPDFLEVAAFRV